MRQALFTLIALALVAFLSRVPVGREPTEAALRLSWKTMGEEVRVRVAEDPNLPAHMRVPGGAYETTILPYRLKVEVNGRMLLDRCVRAAGVHHDRPLSVLEELSLPPGEADLAVSFVPDNPAAPPDSPRWELSTRVTLRAGRVCLITLKRGLEVSH